MKMQFSLLMALFLALPFFAASQAAIHSIEDTFLDPLHIVIRTPPASYYHDIARGGISGIPDTRSNDRVNFQEETRDRYPATATPPYRGLPN